MNTPNSLSKSLRKMQHQQRMPSSLTPKESVASVDIGDWRITQDDDGSLILYNFITGNKIVMAR